MKCEVKDFELLFSVTSYDLGAFGPYFPKYALMLESDKVGITEVAPIPKSLWSRYSSTHRKAWH